MSYRLTSIMFSCRGGIFVKCLSSLSSFLLIFSLHANMYIRTNRTTKANPKLATLKDDDERLPIHWATSYNHRPIVQILISQRSFDPDVQDASGWTPLMIASSLREEDGLVDMLLSKDADVNTKNYSGQVSQLFCRPSSSSVSLLM